MNENSQLNERRKKAEAELQVEYKKREELLTQSLTQSSKDRLARMENFVKYIDIAYGMSDKTQDFNKFMRKFTDSHYDSAEGRYLCMRDYNDPTKDTGPDYKYYKVSCGDLRGSTYPANIYGHRYLKKAEEKLVKYLDELKYNTQYHSHHTQTLKDFIEEANKKQQPLEDRCDRIAKLEKKIHKIGITVPMKEVRTTQEDQKLAKDRKVTQEPALTAFHNAYNDELVNVRAFTKKMKEENDVNWKLSFAKCMQGNIYNLKILANAITDDNVKKAAQNMAKELVDNVEKTINDAERNAEKAATKQNAASVDHNDITIEVGTPSKFNSLQKKNACHQSESDNSLEELKSPIKLPIVPIKRLLNTTQINTTSFSIERDKLKSEMKKILQTSKKPTTSRVQTNTRKDNGYAR